MDNPRDNKWLKARLEMIWKRYFPDIKIQNTVFVRFGRFNRSRLGSIKFGRRRENPNTYITINGYFRNLEIPEFVVDATLTHELSHYAHGFFSPLKQKFRHPHQHSAVRNELTNRGLQDILFLQKKWLKANWINYLKLQIK